MGADGHPQKQNPGHFWRIKIPSFGRIFQDAEKEHVWGGKGVWSSNTHIYHQTLTTPQLSFQTSIFVTKHQYSLKYQHVLSKTHVHNQIPTFTTAQGILKLFWWPNALTTHLMLIFPYIWNIKMNVGLNSKDKFPIKSPQVGNQIRNQQTPQTITILTKPKY